MISHSHRCIFVHIPKTAGNSINRVFGIDWQDHKDLQRYFDELPREVFTAYFKFAIVRNPWDRLLSDYNYQVKKSRAPASKLYVFAADGSKRNFAEWAETALSAPDRYGAGDWGGSVSPHIHRWSPQIDWITADGETRVDFVAHLERLPEDFRFVRHQLGLPPVRLPHRNRRLHWHYSHYYDRTTRELVAAYYARDIAQFGYEFERALLQLSVNWPGARPAAATEAADSSASSETAADPTACTVSFATPRPRAHPPVWQRRPALAIAAGCALLLGIVGLNSLATPLSAEDADAASRSALHMLVRSTTPPRRAPDTLFARAHHFGRSISRLRFSLELLPIATSYGIGVVPAGSEDETHPVAAPPPPTTTRVVSGSGPAPRWWLRRNRFGDD